MKPIDKIYDAYFNGLGNNFGQKVRERIHWICEEATGEQILDVGCSQGITSILLGREGKRVLGLDLINESIIFANEKLKLEEQSTIENVEFKAGNFINEKFDEKFDCIILSEVIEHVTQPDMLINKATSLLKENGKLVITVPFGINDFFDHKKTYYLKGVLDCIPSGFELKKTEFFGKWLGVTLIQSSEKNEIILEPLLEATEKSFYKIERDLVDKNSMLTEKNKVYQKQISEYKKQASEMDSKSKESISKLQNDNTKLNNELAKFKESALKHKRDSIKYKKELLKEYEYQERNLLELKSWIVKYEKLSSAKLVKIQRNYWRLINAFRKKIK